jgi:hypothetical protein
MVLDLAFFLGMATALTLGFVLGLAAGLNREFACIMVGWFQPKSRAAARPVTGPQRT